MVTVRLAPTRRFCLTVLGALALLASGCGADAEFECLKSTGHTRTERREVGAFRRIMAQDNVAVEVVRDSTCFVEVTAGAHLLPKIKTEVKGADLFISNENGCNWVRSYKRPLRVRVHFNTRTLAIHQLGNATITFDRPTAIDSLFLLELGPGELDLAVRADYIWLDMYEYGDVTLRGTTNVMSAFVRGVGFLHAENLDCRDAWVLSERDGDAHIRSHQNMGVLLKSRGNCYYYGTPVAPDLESIGEGKFFRMAE